MKTHKNLYQEIFSLNNLILAWKKARKGKIKKEYVKDFEKNLAYNLKILHDELKNKTYNPKPLEIFILRDPKTRRISKADFRDRVVHHAANNLLEPIFDKTFIFDNCANRKGKGTLFALDRFEVFRRKVTKNFTSFGFCLKADIKHYFQEVNHEILLNIIQRKIKCEKTICLIEKIIRNGAKNSREGNFANDKGMPLGNLTSQFFANLYLNELDYFIKHNLKAKYYLRYVDDFVILHKDEGVLENWKKEIEIFIKERLKLELHPDKTKIISLSKGVDFVGFRNFYNYRLLKKRNIISIQMKLKLFKEGIITQDRFIEVFQGWEAYAKWGDSYNLKKKLFENQIK
jgi:RNA-directed DNA polymerase